MKTISTNKLYELYIDTLEKCSSQKLPLSNEELNTYLFEDFDSGVHSFLHPENTMELLEKNLINENIKSLSNTFRDKAIILLDSKRDIILVRNDQDWKELISLSDELIELNNKYIKNQHQSLK